MKRPHLCPCSMMANGRAGGGGGATGQAHCWFDELRRWRSLLFASASAYGSALELLGDGDGYQGEEEVFFFF
jgi:hypothetical protein